MRWRKQGIGVRWFTWLLASSLASYSAAEQPKADADWPRLLTEWRSRLGTKGAAEAVKELQGMAGPRAVAALDWMLQREPEPRVREMLLAPLARIEGEKANSILLRHAVRDNSPAVRDAARKHLAERHGAPELVRQYASLLRFPDPVRSNSAESLSQLKVPSAIEPLIDALITMRPEIKAYWDPGTEVQYRYREESPTHRREWRKGWGRSPTTRYYRVHVPETNASVLDALKTLTGRDYRYDKEAWRSWWKEQKASRTQTGSSG